MNLVKQLLKKHGVLTSYLLWGTATTVVNLGTYYLCTQAFGINYLYGNLAAWLVSVLFAFCVNKSMVFHSNSWHLPVLLPEFGKFVGVRIFSFLCETGLLWVCVSMMGLPDAIIKPIVDIFVVIFNYIFSRLFIFQ